ncbi:MAG: hypothetical protein K6U89_14195 [Chloroflexi bacterium]|nr:hypothetical protein [Chloroflexota bacterium]
MSRFLDKLRAAARGVPPRIGFGSGGPPPKAPGIGLLAATADLELARSAAPLADAIVLRLAVPPSDLSTQLNGVIYGLEAPPGSAPPDLRTTGADFLVLGLEADAVALRLEEGAKLLQLPREIPDGSLRAVSTLPVDGILTAERLGSRLVVAELLHFLRLGALSSRPLIVAVDPQFAPEQLVSLRDAGIAGVLLPLTGTDDLNALERFRQAIDHFPQPPRKDRPLDRAVPLVTLPPPPPRPAPEPEIPQPETTPFPDDE